jgi:hypothetical protein
MTRLPRGLVSAQAALVTRDLDFGDVRRYPPEQYAGIVVLRLPEEAIAPGIVNVLERFASNSSFTTVKRLSR